MAIFVALYFHNGAPGRDLFGTIRSAERSSFHVLLVSFINVHSQTHERRKKKDAPAKPEMDAEARLALWSACAVMALLIGCRCGNARWWLPELRGAHFRVHFRCFTRPSFCSVILSAVVFNTDVAMGMPVIESQITGSCVARKAEVVECFVVRGTLSQRVLACVRACALCLCEVYVLGI